MGIKIPGTTRIPQLNCWHRSRESNSNSSIENAENLPLFYCDIWLAPQRRIELPKFLREGEVTMTNLSTAAFVFGRDRVIRTPVIGFGDRNNNQLYDVPIKN